MAVPTFPLAWTSLRLEGDVVAVDLHGSHAGAEEMLYLHAAKLGGDQRILGRFLLRRGRAFEIKRDRSAEHLNVRDFLDGRHR